MIRGGGTSKNGPKMGDVIYECSHICFITAQDYHISNVSVRIEPQNYHFSYLSVLCEGKTIEWVTYRCDRLCKIILWVTYRPNNDIRKTLVYVTTQPFDISPITACSSLNMKANVSKFFMVNNHPIPPL